MSVGLLQFSLGLASGQFNSALNTSFEKVKGFAGGLLNMTGTLAAVGAAMKTLEGALDLVEGPKKIIETGASLELLSKQTGESAANLYELQKGFKGVGLDASGVGAMVFHMQKALGGVNEQGESTSPIFSQIGLDMEALKHSGAPEAIEAITAKLGKLDKSSATAAAGKIFGREGAKDALALSRSTDEFAEALHKAAPMAAFFGRMAETFHQIELAAGKVKTKLDPLFAGIAEGAAPAIKKVLDYLNKIDLTKLGASVRLFIGTMYEAIKQGKIGELFSAGFEAGIERAGNLLFATLGDGSFWNGIWSIAWGAFKVQMAGSLKILVSIGDILKAAIETALDTVWEKISANFPKLAQFLGIENFGKAKSFSEHYAEERSNAGPAQQMLDEWIKSGKGDISGGADAIKAVIENAAKNASGPAQARLEKMLGDLGKLWDKGRVKDAPGSPDADKDTLGGNYQYKATELEKMGLVMHGPAISGQDHARETARNTAKMVDLLQKKNDLTPDDVRSIISERTLASFAV
jgi:hypothetical protein